MADSPRIEELKRRVQSDPASIAFAALAEEYRRSGRYEEAITVCRTGLARHPSYISAHVTLGRALLGIGRYEEAREELDQVLKVAPENLAAIRGLAEIHERHGQKSEGNNLSASAIAEMAAALAPLKHLPEPPGGRPGHDAPHVAAPPAPTVPLVSRLHDIIGAPGATKPAQTPAPAGIVGPSTPASGSPGTAAPPAVERPAARLSLRATPQPEARPPVPAVPAPQRAPEIKPPVHLEAPPDAVVGGLQAGEQSVVTEPSARSWWPEGNAAGDSGDRMELSWPPLPAPVARKPASTAVPPLEAPGTSPAPKPAEDPSFLQGDWDTAGALPWEIAQPPAPERPEHAELVRPAQPPTPTFAVPAPAPAPSNPVLERLEAFLHAIEKARHGAGDLRIL